MNKDIQNELKEIAPILSSIAKENPYKVPSGYFEQLTNKVIKKEALPKDYFSQLPNLILEKVKSEAPLVSDRKDRKYKIFNIRNLSIAASFLLLFTASTFWQSNDIEIVADNSWEELPMLSYLEGLEDDFDTDIFLAFNDVLFDTDLEDDGFSDSDLDAIIESLDDSDLETLLN